MDRTGRGGGLALFWRNSLHCQLVDFSSNHIIVEINDVVLGTWRLTGYYGYPNGGRRTAAWNFLRQLSHQFTGPWCIFGDFNDILDASEKRGRTTRPLWLINGFRQAVIDSGLSDVPIEGYPFTWFKSLGTPRAVEERLDRALANNLWFNIFLNATVETLVAPASDHYPIYVNVAPTPRPHVFKRHFRYENAWHLEPGFKDLVTNSWQEYSTHTIISKLSSCAEVMSVWKKSHCHKLKTDIEDCRKQLQKTRLGSAGEDQVRMFELRKRMQRLLSQDDAYWRQRAKTHWYKDGDRNTKFSHASATARKKVNRITSLDDDAGNKITNEQDMQEVARQYFVNIFQQQNSDSSSVIDVINPSVSDNDNEMLTAPISKVEFKDAIFSMHPDTGQFSPDLNITNIALIPKGSTQVSMKDWRPIALCNVLYKIISKVLANRLKKVLPKCISDNQSAFVPERSILDNAMVAIEVGPIIPGRGLRQGDPLSPYLIIICAEGLSSLIRDAETRGVLTGTKVCRQAPSVSHLLFADDCYLFFKANEDQAHVMKHILSTYELASGQAISLPKSEIYCSRNVPDDLKANITDILGVQLVLGIGKYLGLPSMIGRDRNATFAYIKDRVWQKINSWSCKCLSKVGREVMIKSVLQAIPSYAMSIFQLPTTLLDSIEKMMNSFWWGNGKTTQRGIHWMNWEKLSAPKIHGARYFPSSSYLTATVGHNPSYVWHSIMRARFIVRGGARWSVGSGATIPILNEPWLPNGEFISSDIPGAHFVRNFTVNSLMNLYEKTWNEQVVRKVFSDDIANKILHTPLISQVDEDRIIWKAERHGRYSVRSAYRSLGFGATRPSTTASASEAIFYLLETLSVELKQRMPSVLWSIWKHRNLRVWDDVTETSATVVERARNMLTDWQLANAPDVLVSRSNHQPTTASTSQQHRITWQPPVSGRYKCNIDAAFSSHVNRTCIGICVRDAEGTFVLAKTMTYPCTVPVEVGEALGLHFALQWLSDMQFDNLDFETDSKLTAEAFRSTRNDLSEFGCIISSCRSLFSTFFSNSRVEFVRRQAYVVAHALAREATSAEIYRFQGIWVASITPVVLFVRIQKNGVVAFPVGSHAVSVGPEMDVYELVIVLAVGLSCITIGNRHSLFDLDYGARKSVLACYDMQGVYGTWTCFRVDGRSTHRNDDL
ncbi:uncharacterized protein [Medicago truncatula]|uniref:uncharacterized protein n=1 Tax=Medicago truncatula TaxID=3880 RepID=UPI001967F862|nr:uncharacterized protein LOC120577483 [Medicago truncatula]